MENDEKENPGFFKKWGFMVVMILGLIVIITVAKYLLS
jgi:hypothetical protein